MSLDAPLPSSSYRGGNSQMTANSVPSESSLRPLRALQSGLENNGCDLAASANVPFAFTPEILSQLWKLRSHAAIRSLGGLLGLAKGLQSDLSSGLSQDEITLKVVSDDGSHGVTTTQQRGHDTYVDRKVFFGENRLPEKKTKSIFQLMWIAFNDKVIVLLSIAATISLALGLYQTFGQPHVPGKPKVEWVEGVTIMTAVVIVVVAGALNDYQKEQQFVRLNKKKEDRLVKAIRSGRSMEISIYDVLVGDVLHLEPGDMIPADGILITGHNVRCDEASATGESDQIKKIGGKVIATRMAAGLNVDKLDPFIISGSKVLEGIGTYLVTCVGVHSTYGRLKIALTEDTEATPLQKKLGIVASKIAIAAVAVATFLFGTLFLRFLGQLPTSHDSPSEKGQTFLRILITSISLVVVAVPEGLPLAVTLALAIAATRMLKDNNLVRILVACETMGNATIVCSDKTGTLTMNKMTVTTGILGIDDRFGDGREYHDQGSPNSSPAMPNSCNMNISEFVSTLSMNIRNLLVQSVAINSTAFESDEDGRITFIGSTTEAALLSFAKERLGMGPLDEERSSVVMVERIPFDSSRKYMASVIQLSSYAYRMFVKGAPEMILEKCTRTIRDATQTIDGISLTTDAHLELADVIDEYATHSLRTIAIAYRDFESWPPPTASFLNGDPNEIDFETLLDKMTFLGVMGIRDPLRPGVREAVINCQHAGVDVKMVTGDNVGTARAIARECGILTEEGLVIEGPVFRKLPEAEMYQILPRLQVLARSSPEDKRILVKRLKELGETVAVTGDGTNDGPALRTADVGFSMGISGTEIAKEASSIILMDDNFSSMVKAIEWGRTVNDAIRKFLQFQLTVNITAVTLTIVSAISSDKEESILTPVQLLWVNLIMDTFAALALATDPPSPRVLDRPPDRKSAPLITLNMWKMIIGQAFYQLAVTLTLYFAGSSILGSDTPAEMDTLQTFIFNTFVFMQLFNMYNDRRLDRNLNIFEGVSQNWYLIGVSLVTVAGQVLIILFGGSALSTTPLSPLQWGFSIFLGALSIPVGMIIRLVPDSLFDWQHYSSVRADRYLSASTHSSCRDPRSISNKAIESIRSVLISIKQLSHGILDHLSRDLPVQNRNRTTTSGSTLEDSELPSDERRPLLRVDDDAAQSYLKPSSISPLTLPP